MVRSYIRTCAASVVAIGLATTVGGVSAETPAVPVPAAPATAAAAPATVAATAVAPAPMDLTVTPETATVLTKVIDAGLRQWFPPTGPSVGYQWDANGNTTVTAAGDHFDVTLPSLQINSDDGSRITVGVIRMTLTPAPGAALDIALTVPGTIALLDADGKVGGEVTIGSQHFDGRWLPSVSAFVKVDGHYGNLRAASHKDQTRMEIGNLTVGTDLIEQAAGRWSGPSTLAIQDLSVVDEHGTQVARLGTFALKAFVSGMDLGHAVTLGHPPVSAAATGKESAPEEAQAAMRRHLEMLHNLFSSASATLSLGNLVVTAPVDHSTVTLGKVTLGGSIEGLDAGKATVALNYSHGGLTIEPNPTPHEFLPEAVTVDIAAADLPNAGLWQAFQTLLEPVAVGRTEDQAGQQFAQQALGALTQGASRLRVDALTIETPAAAATIKGEARFNDRAALGAVAGFDMVLRGLDAAMTKIQPAPGTKVDEDTQSTLAMVSMIQAFGAPGKDDAGHDTRTYKLEVGTNGKIMLNGADMSALLQAGSGSDAAPGGAKGTKNAP